MPVTESQFSRASLWPVSSHNWMAPGAATAQAGQYGQGLDLGALRINDAGFWEIIIAGTWWLFEPTDPQHFLYASAFRRYGPGWAYGPGHNLHDEVTGYFIDLNGREPTPMEKLDIEHDKGLWEGLLRDYAAKFPEPAPKPTDPGEKPPPTERPPEKPVEKPGPGPLPPPLPPLPPLSPVGQRVAELLSLLPAAFNRPWMVPIATEAVLAFRRAQERQARLVAERVREMGERR